jgi:diguanylate cyclase (GGDEF)-like protein
MAMAPFSQNNTVNFDAARQQRIELSHPKEPLGLIAPAQRLQRLNLLLQTSLDVERILCLFFTELQLALPADTLSYRHSSSDVHLEIGTPATHSASYRLSYENEDLGELSLRRQRRFSEQELAQLESLLTSLLLPLRNALLYRAAIQSALRDPLTRTGNRIAMDQALQREIDVARRRQQPLSLLMLDIDHFKQINDRYGHCAGDEALKTVAHAIKNQLRNIDSVYRYGGEEFLVLLANTACADAALVAERLRLAIEQLRCEVQSAPISLSISLGCATLKPGETPDTLLDRTDRALYRAKAGGRNRLYSDI